MQQTKKLMGTLYIATSLVFISMTGYFVINKYDGSELVLRFTAPIHIFSIFFLIFGFILIFSRKYDGKIVDISITTNKNTNKKYSKILLSNFIVIPLIILSGFICAAVIPDDGWGGITISLAIIFSSIIYLVLSWILYLIKDAPLENTQPEIYDEQYKQNWNTAFYKKTKNVYYIFLIITLVVSLNIFSEIQGL